MVPVPLGFNPWWDTEFAFEVVVPDLALVRFLVEDYDASSKNDFIGQSTIPLNSLKQGECQEKGTARLAGNRAWYLLGWGWLSLEASRVTKTLSVFPPACPPTRIPPCPPLV